ncbi:MAG: TraB/GumN family protein [Gammaproteobacteria bacterium]|nr:TraB/GumN family protein [Gammaproteobacteria bacterium]
MKTLRRLLVPLLLWAPLAAPVLLHAAPLQTASTTASAATFSKGLLWKIERPGVKPSYVFGTIHSEDARVLAVPPMVQQTFDGAKSFTMEVVLDEAVSQQMAARMFLGSGPDLKSLLGAELFERAAVLMANYGMPREAVQKLKPWVVFTTLSLPKPQAGLFLDLVLQVNAAQQGKPVYGLESADEQLAVFDGMALQDQITLLKEAVENYAQLTQELQQTIERYLARDLAGMEQLSNDESSKLGDARLVETINRRMIYDRNVRMVERMTPRLKEGNAFVAIGSLHLPGDQGVLRLLQRRGYSVSVMY